LIVLGCKFPVAYETISTARSNARRCGRGNCFDLGPNPECVARSNSFASPNRGIARSKCDCNGEAIRNGVSNYTWHGHTEFVN
jgi:hypothetical protein